MPYKDPAHKREWELYHRPQRIARRRELRRTEAVRKTAHLETPPDHDSSAALLWVPVAGGVAVASYNPMFAIGAGGLTLLGAAVFKKGWIWWFVGIVALAAGLYFQWNEKNEK